MKKIVLLAPSLVLMALPLIASAHEMATYNIGGSMYQIVVGSLNEPVAVDDKTGVDLTVNKCYSPACTPTKGPDGDMDGPAGTPVTGLESSVKVELVAGDQKKSLTLSPQYGQDGKYTAAFYPTIATTFSYHFAGTIANTPVDLTFTCIPEGTPIAAMNTTPTKLSDSVTQMSTSGGFGCPVPKADLGFPKESVSVDDLAASAGGAKSQAQTALATGAVALVFSVLAFRRKNQ